MQNSISFSNIYQSLTNNQHTLLNISSFIFYFNISFKYTWKSRLLLLWRNLVLLKLFITTNIKWVHLLLLIIILKQVDKVILSLPDLLFLIVALQVTDVLLLSHLSDQLLTVIYIFAVLLLTHQCKLHWKYALVYLFVLFPKIRYQLIQFRLKLFLIVGLLLDLLIDLQLTNILNRFRLNRLVHIWQKSRVKCLIELYHILEIVFLKHLFLLVHNLPLFIIHFNPHRYLSNFVLQLINPMFELLLYPSSLVFDQIRQSANYFFSHQLTYFIEIT